MTPLYLPVSMDSLPEYMSSGFVGLQSDSAEGADLQANLFPNVIAIREPAKSDSTCLLVCKVEQDIVASESGDSMILKGPVSIGCVSKILFEDEEALAEFESIYAPMPDIHMPFYELAVLPQGSVPDLDSVLGKLKTPRKSALRIQPSHGAAIAYALGDALPSLLDKDFECKLSAAKPRDLVTKLIFSALLANNAGDFQTSVSEHLLEIYFDALEQMASGSLKSAALIADMEGICRAKVEAPSSPQIWSSCMTLIHKLQKISMGLEDEPSFADDPTLVLQRAICLTCLIDNFDDFQAVRRNWTVGVHVEAIAKILVACRTNIAQIAGRSGSLTRDKFFGALAAGAEFSKKGALNVEVKRSSMDADFSSNVAVLLNDHLLSSERLPARNDLMRVVAELKACGYSPRPQGDRRIVVEYFRDKTSQAVPVSIEIVEGPTARFKQNIDIYCSVECPAGKSRLATKMGRQRLFDLARTYLVSLSESPLPELEVHRYQLIDTMDREEMNFHVELVALASLEISAEL